MSIPNALPLTIQSFNICSANRDERDGIKLYDRIEKVADKILQGMQEHGASIIALQEVRFCCLDDQRRSFDPLQAIIQRIAEKTGVSLESTFALNSEDPTSFSQALLWNPAKVRCDRQQTYQCTPEENQEGRVVVACEFTLLDDEGKAIPKSVLPTVRVACIHLSPLNPWKDLEAPRLADLEEERGGKDQVRVVLGDFNAFPCDKVKPYQYLEQKGYVGALGKGYGQGWKNQDGVAVTGSFLGYTRKDGDGKELLDPFAVNRGIGHPLDWAGVKYVDANSVSHGIKPAAAFVDTSLCPDSRFRAIDKKAKTQEDLMTATRYAEVFDEATIPYSKARPGHLGNAYASDHLPLIIKLNLGHIRKKVR